METKLERFLTRGPESNPISSPPTGRRTVTPPLHSEFEKDLSETWSGGPETRV